VIGPYGSVTREIDFQGTDNGVQGTKPVRCAEEKPEKKKTASNRPGTCEIFRSAWVRPGGGERGGGKVMLWFAEDRQNRPRAKSKTLQDEGPK